ncbi:hypothetical protein KIW84_022865 [Lathyrus oleraceus]|uniref:PIK-related kinase FAT domain-containing protein n=1 Tax=Pisum sativum TaxID=3888 RepID=A0A9D4YHC8_PEA|nr:hypothetical protein KIW84_022865 [Pisum sativum]
MAPSSGLFYQFHRGKYDEAREYVERSRKCLATELAVLVLESYEQAYSNIYDPEITPENVQYHGPPQVMLAYLKFQWSLREDSKRREAFVRLQNLAMECSNVPNIQPVTHPIFTSGLNPNVPLLARVDLNLGSCQWALSPGLVEESIKDILDAFLKATQYANKWAKAWHKWAFTTPNKGKEGVFFGL